MTFTHNIMLVLFFCITNTWAHSRVDFESINLNASDHGGKLLDKKDGDVALVKSILPGDETVRIQLYYESLCPHCISSGKSTFAAVVETMSQYLDIQTYPFGNAKVINDNGKLEFKCQHGPKECYGNKLHACALDKLQHTTALLYNICLMNSTSSLGSDDKSADRCGKSMNIDSEPIKECAKGTRGMELLRYYGEESKKVHFWYVPYVLINGKEFNGHNFKNAVCSVFTSPPPSCE